MSMTNKEYRPLSLMDLYPFWVNSIGDSFLKEIKQIYNARKERKGNSMDNRNYSVEQWLSGMIGDRRFYPARSVRKYMEEQLDSKFVKLPEFGECIIARNGYHITVNEEDCIVNVEVYDTADENVFSASWKLRP